MAKKKSLPKHIKQNLATLDRMKAAAKDLAAPAKPPGRGSAQFVLRYSDEMRDRIAHLAKSQGMSINAMLIALLERALSHGDHVEQLQQSTAEIFNRLEKLEGLVGEHDARLSGRDPYNEER
jgi:predicted HicB family RNase H-like nuclease